MIPISTASISERQPATVNSLCKFSGTSSKPSTRLLIPVLVKLPTFCISLSSTPGCVFCVIQKPKSVLFLQIINLYFKLSTVPKSNHGTSAASVGPSQSLLPNIRGCKCPIPLWKLISYMNLIPLLICEPHALWTTLLVDHLHEEILSYE